MATLKAETHHLEFEFENSSSRSTFINQLFTQYPNSTLETPSSIFYPVDDIIVNATTPINNNSVHMYHSNEYIFDRTDIRALFITLYTIVFCFCFFGNLMVILVVTLHWRMRSITNFCLVNLAISDFFVGCFCVYQNIISYMMESWIFGEFLCKMYHFISSLTSSAACLILVVICIERYLAIIHPMSCKQVLTINRLRVTIVGVWVLSALISSPRFYYFNTISMSYPDGKVEILCVPIRSKYDSKTVDMISMVLLFLVPLLVISALYFRIGVSLWKSSSGRMPSVSTSAESSSSSCRECCESTAAANHPLNSFNPSPASTAKNSREKRPFFDQLNCLKCKRESKSRHKRTCGSFYGTSGSDKLIYKTINPGNNATINGMGNGNLPQGSGSGVLERRSTNGLLISCNGNSLHPITSTSTLHSANECPSISHPPNGELGGGRISLKCCSCKNTFESIRGSESVPVSPYLKRDSTPLSPPATISSTEPIVLVKFEKRKSHKKCKKTKCTILIRSAVSASTLNEKESCGEALGELSNLPPYLQNGKCNNCLKTGSSTCTLTASSRNLEGCGCSGCSCELGAEISSSMIAYCQLCEKKYSAEGLMKNSGIQHDAHLGYSHLGSGATSAANTVDGRCDKNLDCISHFTAKDPIPTPTHHHAAISFSNGHHCTSCLGQHHSSPTYKIPATTKGPKRMRVIRSSKYGMRALQCRRRIIKMLIVIVFAFALCHLPFHARKIWQYWGKGYEAASVFSQLFTPITFLIMYAQSGINPILYAFMSRKFRNSFADLLCCNMRRSLKISRNFSVRSTNAIQLSQTT